MSPIIVIARTIIRELFTKSKSERVPEPDLIMDGDDSVAMFNEVAKTALSPIYLYGASHSCGLIRPNDKVVDFGCGPANQLNMMAKIHPEAHFTGVDLSQEMLKVANENAKEKNLNNVSFQEGNICNLSFIEDHTVDFVISTFALHHLPDISDLDKASSEIKRILKQNGVLYLLDFSRFKSEKSIEDFTSLEKEKYSELFTTGYYNSLRAAFYFDDLKDIWQKHLTSHCEIHTTYPVSFFVMYKSRPRVECNEKQRAALRKIYMSMDKRYQKDFRKICLSIGVDSCKLKKLVK